MDEDKKQQFGKIGWVEILFLRTEKTHDFFSKKYESNRGKQHVWNEHEIHNSRIKPFANSLVDVLCRTLRCGFTHRTLRRSSKTEKKQDRG
jgi:hypothetical protein